MAGEDVAYYTLPVILSFDGVEKQIGGKLDKAFNNVGKNASKSIGSGLKSLEQDVKSAADAYDKLQNKASDALGKTRTEEAKLVELRNAGKQNTAQYIAIEERFNKARRDSGTATKAAEEGHTALLSAQNALSNSSDNLGGRFGKLSGFADLAGTAIKGAAVVAAGAAVVGIGALVAGVVLAGKALYDLGAEFDDVFDNIRIKTGATGPALQELENATTRLATKVPVSIAEIGNVVAETSRALHLTGTDLDNTAKSIANLGRLTGEAVDVRLLGKAFRGFGVEAADQTPALDGLFRATQSTGIGVNELLATVVKGGAGLRQFGFDFGTSAALATQFEEAGLDADKAMAGLTKGLAGLAKDGQTGQDALRGSVQGIKDLLAAGNDAGALDLTNKLFGAKGGVQFFEAIKNGALDLDSLATSISSTGDTIAGAAADTDDWAERWQLFKNGLKVGLEPIGTAVFDSINGKLTELADWVDKHKPEVIEFFTDVGVYAVEAFAKVTHAVAGALRGLGDFITEGLQPILRGIQDWTKNSFFASLLPGAEEIGDAAGKMADGLDGTSDSLDRAADKVDGFADQVKDKAVPYLQELGDRAANSQRFIEGLGDATAAVPDGKTIQISSNSPEVVASLEAIGIKVTTLPDGKFGVDPQTEEAARILDAFIATQTKRPIEIPVDPALAQANEDLSAFFARWAKQSIQPTIAPPLSGPSSGAPLPLPGQPVPVPRRAHGGIYDVWDSVASFANGGRLPARAMIQPATAGGLVQWAEPETKGEAFIPLAPEKRERSLQIWAETGRRLNAYEEGGIRGIDALSAEASSLQGTQYSQASGDDCSGTMSQLVNATLGLPPKVDRMSTATAMQWLIKKGAALGIGPEGTFRLGWKNGGPGGGHMAGTLPDGTNVEMGGAGGGYQLGGSAAGADDPQFTDHAYLPFDALYPDGYASGSGSAPAYGSGGSGGTAGVGPNGESGTYGAPDAKAVREADQKVADADFKVKQAEQKLSELKADAKQSTKDAAVEDVAKAKRDAADARTDATEAKKGKFTAGKGGKGGQDVSEIGSIFGSFIKETFGLDGSLFPDIGNLFPVQAAGTIIGALTGGGAGGGDGIVPGAATSNSPFGLPEIPAPGLPAGNDHLGPNAGGLPGPVTNVDLSTTYGGDVGLSPDEIFKRQKQNQDRGVAKINGMSMGVGN